MTLAPHYTQREPVLPEQILEDPYLYLENDIAEKTELTHAELDALFNEKIMRADLLLTRLEMDGDKIKLYQPDPQWPLVSETD